MNKLKAVTQKHLSVKNTMANEKDLHTVEELQYQCTDQYEVVRQYALEFYKTGDRKLFKDWSKEALDLHEKCFEQARITAAHQAELLEKLYRKKRNIFGRHKFKNDEYNSLNK